MILYPYEVFQTILYNNGICIDLIISANNYLIKFVNSNIEIRQAVNLWCDNENALLIYGNISYWDVSKVTDMKQLFTTKLLFNDNSNIDTGMILSCYFINKCSTIIIKILFKIKSNSSSES